MASLPLEAEVYVALQRAAGAAACDMARLLRAHGLTPSSYNVLRILRGAGPAGLPSGEIGARLLQHDPDVTRLLDRMEKQGWIARARSAADRRVVLAHATKSGLALVTRLDKPVNQRHAATLGHLPPRRLKTLLAELRAVRESFSPEEASK